MGGGGRVELLQMKKQRTKNRKISFIFSFAFAFLFRILIRVFICRDESSMYIQRKGCAVLCSSKLQILDFGLFEMYDA